MPMQEKVILVDEQDQEIGEEEKMRAHREGRLHRSFSIFIFNSKGEMLLQKRAKSKYHSGGLWTNACCGHPRPASTGQGGGKIINIKLPIKMEFIIKEAPPSIRGNTANGGGKVAILENGVKIQVPFFVEAGNKIRVNTETGEYAERV